MSAQLNKVPHGLLFHGEKAVGKKASALEFIKLLFCEAGPAFCGTGNLKEPCQKCRSCRVLQKNQHPDLLLIEPQTSEIQISQIRELGLKHSLKPHTASLKAAIVDQAHLMNGEAQSCFLKLLEEPKGNAILILATEYPEMLLPTIISRVQKIKFHTVPKEEIKEHLIKQGALKEKAEKIALISRGRPGLAIDLFLNPEKLKAQEKAISDIAKINKSSLVSRFEYVKALCRQLENGEENIELNGILEIWLGYFRDILISAINNSADFQKNSLIKLRKIIKLIQKTIFLISGTNVNSKLALEILMLEI